jgi:uncharacterized membrane protein
MNGNFKTINATQSISEGFNLAGKNWGLNIAFVIVYFIIAGIAGIMLSFVPLGGQVFNSIVAPILIFGFGIVAHKFAKNQRVDFGEYFDGFKMFMPLFLTNLLKTVVTFLAVVPLLMYLFNAFGGFDTISRIIALSSDPMAIEELRDLVMDSLSDLNFPLLIVLGLIAFLPTFFLMFAMFFVWYKNAEPMDAIKQSFELVKANFGQVLLFSFLWFLILMVSVLPCGIGLLFTMPALGCATYAAFVSAVDIGADKEFDVIEHLVG